MRTLATKIIMLGALKMRTSDPLEIQKDFGAGRSLEVDGNANPR